MELPGLNVHPKNARINTMRTRPGTALRFWGQPGCYAQPDGCPGWTCFAVLWPTWLLCSARRVPGS